MLHWIPYVFVRIVVFFMAGILVGIYWGDGIPEFYAVAGFGLLVLLYFFLFLMRRISHRQFINLGFVGLPAVFIAGYLVVLFQTDSRAADHILNLKTPTAYYRAIITKYPEEKDRTWKTEAKILEVQTAGHWKKYQGRILLYFSKEGFDRPFQYGDVLLIKGQPQELKPPANPGEFDHKRFLSYRKIYHQQYLRPADVLFCKHDPPHWLIHYAFQTRQWAGSILKNVLQGEREQSIALALVLGVTEGLDHELLNAYAATGTIHILAVSGLHVGIIYWLILLLFRPLKNTTEGKWILAVLSMAVLWMYAFVTGLSPSVLRAVTMFSFVALAIPLRQRTNIYNTLAASAFVLLLYEPYLIMSVGFQLSDLAVVGIVYLHPALYTLIEPKNRFWDEVWKISSVSIAAQLATFPLALFYFHQFPNYFLLSNLFAIPVSSVVLVMGLVVLLVGFIQPVASFLGMVLEGIIKLMNFIIFTVESLPYSIIENVYISAAQCWLLMGMIVAIILLIRYKKFFYLPVAGMLAIMFSVLQWIHFQHSVNEQRITVYNIPGSSAVDLIDCGQTYFLTDAVLYDQMEKARFHIQPNRLFHQVNVVKKGAGQPFIKPFKGGRLVRWHNKLILQIIQKNFTLPPYLPVDYLIISNNAVSHLPAVLNRIDAAEVIVDSSNTRSLATKILKDASTIKANVHSVLHNGAFNKLI